jgi:hypothetical protein
MEGAGELAAVPEFGIEPRGLGQRRLVDGDEGVQLRARLVVGRDPVEIALDQLDRRKRAREICGMDAADRRFLDAECPVRRHDALLRLGLLVHLARTRRFNPVSSARAATMIEPLMIDW